MAKYNCGVSEAVLISHLQCKWDRQQNKLRGSSHAGDLQTLHDILHGKSQQVTSTATLFAKISAVDVLPGTSVHIATLVDFETEASCEWYLPSQFHFLQKDFFSDRAIKLAQCRLVHSYGVGFVFLVLRQLNWGWICRVGFGYCPHLALSFIYTP